MLTAEGLTVRYGRITALEGVGVTITPGSLTAVLGLNGAGKSSLVQALCGLVRPAAGRVMQEGHDVTALPLHRRTGVALMPEGRILAPTLSVTETLRLGAGPVGARVAAERQASLFDRFPKLAARRDQKAGALSGGEATLLALARALMAAPRYLMLDEPTLGLSPAATARVFDTLAGLRAEGLGLLLVEQNLHAALAQADRFLVLQAGRAVLQGDAKDAPSARALEDLLISGGERPC